MNEWMNTKISSFLFERKGKFKPNAPALYGLQRLEKIDFSGNFYLGNKVSNTDMILIKKGDFVISGINIAKGAMGIYELTHDACATIHYSSYTFDANKINPDYFQVFLKSPEFIRILKSQTKGGIKTEIKAQQLLSLEIKLPSLLDQEKIIQDINNFNEKYSSLVRGNIKQQHYLSNLRQQILSEAVSGKLTEKWRIKNSDMISALLALKEVAEKKVVLIDQGKIRKGKTTVLERSNDVPFLLPKTWVWTRLENIIYEPPRNGYSPKAVNYITETKTLKLGATSTGIFLKDEIKYINEKINKDSFLWLKKGDILIQRSNALNLVGVSAIFEDNNNEFIYPDLMMKIQVCPPIVNQYIYMALSAPFTREYFRRHASGSQQSMPKINQSIVSGTFVPLPSVDEQIAIVEKVQTLMEKCDQIKVRITQDRENIKRMMRSYLKEVFHG